MFEIERVCGCRIDGFPGDGRAWNGVAFGGDGGGVEICEERRDVVWSVAGGLVGRRWVQKVVGGAACGVGITAM